MWLPWDEEEKELKKFILDERIEGKEIFEKLEANKNETDQMVKALLIEDFALRVAKRARKFGGKVGIIQGVFIGAVVLLLIQSLL